MVNNSDIKNECKEFIKTLSTEICRQILLDDLKKINENFNSTENAYEVLNENFKENIKDVNSEIIKLQQTNRKIENFIEGADKNNIRIDSALNMLQDEHKIIIDKILKDNDELFKQYNEKVLALNEKEKEELIEALTESIDNLSRSYLEQLKEIFESNNQKVSDMKNSSTEEIKEIFEKNINAAKQMNLSNLQALKEMTSSNEEILKEIFEKNVSKAEQINLSNKDTLKEMNTSHENVLKEIFEKNIALVTELNASQTGELRELFENNKNEVSKINENYQNALNEILEKNENAETQRNAEQSEKINAIFEENKNTYLQLTASHKEELKEILDKSRNEVSKMNTAYTGELKEILAKSENNMAEMKAGHADEIKALIEGLILGLENERKSHISQLKETTENQIAELKAAGRKMEEFNIALEENQKKMKETASLLSEDNKAAIQKILKENKELFDEYKERVRSLGEIEKKNFINKLVESVNLCSDKHIDRLTGLTDIEIKNLENTNEKIEELYKKIEDYNNEIKGLIKLLNDEHDNAVDRIIEKNDALFKEYSRNVSEFNRDEKDSFIKDIKTEIGKATDDYAEKMKIIASSLGENYETIRNQDSKYRNDFFEKLENTMDLCNEKLSLTLKDIVDREKIDEIHENNIRLAGLGENFSDFEKEVYRQVEDIKQHSEKMILQIQNEFFKETEKMAENYDLKFKKLMVFSVIILIAIIALGVITFIK